MKTGNSMETVAKENQSINILTNQREKDPISY